MSKSAKPTLGPWLCLPEEASVKYIRVRGTILGRKFKIANVVCETPAELEEARANARLIAAAPDLYRALRNLVHAVRGSAAAQVAPGVLDALSAGTGVLVKLPAHWSE